MSDDESKGHRPGDQGINDRIRTLRLVAHPPVADWTAVPHLSQYFGAWAMPDDQFRNLAGTILDGDLAAHIREADIERVAAHERGEAHGPLDDRGFTMIDGTTVALIELRGAMTKYGSSFSDLENGTIGLRRAVRSAAADNEISAILLRVDSPGGSVAGTGDLADEVFDARAVKPVFAYIEDLGASAAYWVAAQATKVFVNPTAIVGSIGTYGVVIDTSARFERAGVKVHVVRAGQFKGIGTPGTSVTDEHLAEAQRVVDSINELFIEAIVRGRALTAEHVQAIATGAVWIGADALGVGLIDGVEAIDGVVAQIQRASGTAPTQTEIVVMADVKTIATPEPKAATGAPHPGSGAPPPGSPAPEAGTLLEARVETTQPAAATLTELRQKFPDSTADWRESCQLAAMTLTHATEAWATHLQAELTKEHEARVEAEKSAKTVQPPGAEPNTTVPDAEAQTFGGDPTREWRQRFGECMKRTGGNRIAAIKLLDRDHPGLRQAFVTAANEAARRPVPELLN